MTALAGTLCFCEAMLCYAMRCYGMLSYAMLCCAMLWDAMLMAFVAEFSPVAICERDLHLREEYLLECRAQILRHIRSICELIQATVTIKVCTTDSLWRFVSRCLSAVA